MSRRGGTNAEEEFVVSCGEWNDSDGECGFVVIKFDCTNCFQLHGIQNTNAGAPSARGGFRSPEDLDWKIHNFPINPYTFTVLSGKLESSTEINSKKLTSSSTRCLAVSSPKTR